MSRRQRAVVGLVETYLRVRRFAGVECCSRLSKSSLDLCYERIRATQHAACGPCRILERSHGLAEIVERGAGVEVDGYPVIRPNGPRGACSVARTRSQKGLGTICPRLEARSAPAKG